jgi:dTMP kinase
MNNYIVFEGYDGSGKTFLSRKYAHYLINRKLKDVVWTNEPNSTIPICKTLREFVLDRQHDMVVNPEAREYMLFASRAISTQTLKNTLKQGIGVVCDRGFLSGMVYAKVASGMSFQRWWLHGQDAIQVFPDVIVYVESLTQKIDVTEGDIYDTASDEFHNEIKETFGEAIKFLREVKPDVKIVHYENDLTIPEKDIYEAKCEKLYNLIEVL